MNTDAANNSEGLAWKRNGSIVPDGLLKGVALLMERTVRDNIEVFN